MTSAVSDRLLGEAATLGLASNTKLALAGE